MSVEEEASPNPTADAAGGRDDRADLSPTSAGMLGERESTPPMQTESDAEPTEGPEPNRPPTATPPLTQMGSMKLLALATLLIAGATGFALQPDFSGTWKLWACIAAPYVLLAPFSLHLLNRHDVKLGQLLGFRGGDTSIGIVMGMIMVGSGVFVLDRMAAPGTATFAWLFQLYAQVGNYQSSGSILVLMFVVIVAEELVWRGWIQEELTQLTGKLAIPLCALLYAAAQAPAALALKDPSAGLNPLPIVAALIAGLCWSTARAVLGRLSPIVLCHLVFTYFMAAPIPAWLKL